MNTLLINRRNIEPTFLQALPLAMFNRWFRQQHEVEAYGFLTFNQEHELVIVSKRTTVPRVLMLDIISSFALGAIILDESIKELPSEDALLPILKDTIRLRGAWVFYSLVSKWIRRKEEAESDK